MVILNHGWYECTLTARTTVPSKTRVWWRGARGGTMDDRPAASYTTRLSNKQSRQPTAAAAAASEPPPYFFSPTSKPATGIFRIARVARLSTCRCLPQFLLFSFHSPDVYLAEIGSLPVRRNVFVVLAQSTPFRYVSTRFCF